MLIQSDISAAIDTYERNALESIQKAKSVALPSPNFLSFSTFGMIGPKIDELAQGVTTGKKKEEKGSEFIYVFRLSPLNRVSAESVLNAFNTVRSIQETADYQGKKNLCRLNPQAIESKALYVGRSYGPRERLKDHLRSSTSGTYAIHFAAWASQIDLRVEFYLYKFAGVGDRVVQVLEDGLWDHLRPIFGRRGEK